jgi:SAM-dependent methyltransferase
MGYYDTIAYQWHNYTGYQGGSFKKYVLNDFLRSHMESIQDKAILEVGAGNGYFMAWVLERFSGQTPERLVISGISNQLLSIAETHFYLPLAQYLQLDIRSHFPFPAGEFDLVVATMVFNELTDAGVRRGLSEIHRALSSDGVLLLSVTHPDFIHSLDRRGALKVYGQCQGHRACAYRSFNALARNMKNYLLGLASSTNPSILLPTSRSSRKNLA